MAYSNHETESKKLNRKTNTGQNVLFNDYNGGKPETEWTGMPEFIQEKQKPYQKIIIRFDSLEDVESFARAINQKLTPKTKSIWFPFKSHWGAQKKEWIDES